MFRSSYQIFFTRIQKMQSNVHSSHQFTISAWNVRGLGDKMKDDLFRNKIQSDINILIETWKGILKIIL